jgi:branched-chain amino acid transport system substrate-binding protein
MAHSAIVLCYDGASRVPKIVRRYDDLDGVL